METVEWIAMMHKQNLNGRETEDELFEAGIEAGIEETKKFIMEFAIFCSSYIYDSQKKAWYLRYSFQNFPKHYTHEEILEIFNQVKNGK